MNTRLVWNFEINHKNLLNIETLKAEKEALRWEARFFWPEHTIIVLNGLSEIFLHLSHYQIKHRYDQYLILPNNFNIKERETQLVYKPLLQKKNSLYGYGKKINLNECSEDEFLPATNKLTAKTMLNHLKEAFSIEVVKEALLYTFPTNPKIKLELSRLQIKKEVYFSVCLEGRSQQMVGTIAEQLLGKNYSSDYISFLKNFLHYDHD